MNNLEQQIDEYLNYCQFVRGMSAETIKAKRFVYRHLIAESGVDNVRLLRNCDINRFIYSWSKSGLCGKTINNRITHIVAMLKYYRDMGEKIAVKIPLIPKAKEQQSRRVFYTRGEISEALRCADDITWLLIKIAFDTGMRISELTNLRLSDFSGNRVNYVGKGSKLRESYVSRETTRRLDRWCMDHNIHDDDYLWASPAKGYTLPYGTEAIRYMMRKPFREVGHNDFYPHALRHSFATDIQLNGAGILESKEMLGHSRIETTQRYLHGLDGSMNQLFAKYKQFNS